MVLITPLPFRGGVGGEALSWCSLGTPLVFLKNAPSVPYGLSRKTMQDSASRVQSSSLELLRRRLFSHYLCCKGTKLI